MEDVRFKMQQCLLILIIFIYASSHPTTGVAKEELSCSASDEHDDPVAQGLKEMSYNIGYGPQTIMAYVEPNVTSFYRNRSPPASTKVFMKFNGLATKFINLSNKNLHLYWEPYRNSPTGAFVDMGALAAFGASGSASHPGHRYLFCTADKLPKVLHRVIIEEHPKNTYAYDPYYVEGDAKATEKNLQSAQLTEDEHRKYQQWRDTLAFSEEYLKFTGRSYIANYLRSKPRHFMWQAHYFGQEHWVTSRETHFSIMPPTGQLGSIQERGKERILSPESPRILSEYRDPNHSILNMTLRVLSCAPRVFEIDNFLSPTEIDHILHVAGGISLGRSTVGDVGKDHVVQEEQAESVANTRTSLNSWLARETSPIFDAVYRRAADLMRIDEALLRSRDDDELPDFPTKNSVAESLQLVHYEDGQKYTAHHDFGFSGLSDNPSDEKMRGFEQGTRFATLLLYLNDDGLKGGETTFPRWSNAETFDQLRVKPVEGKAVLFYSQLPDGNLDDFSQHAALHPREGEKWLMNLWVWDPIFSRN